MRKSGGKKEGKKCLKDLGNKDRRRRREKWTKKLKTVFNERVIF